MTLDIVLQILVALALLTLFWRLQINSDGAVPWIVRTILLIIAIAMLIGLLRFVFVTATATDPLRPSLGYLERTEHVTCDDQCI